jgi:hypothetical protein
MLPGWRLLFLRRKGNLPSAKNGIVAGAEPGFQLLGE